MDNKKTIESIKKDVIKFRDDRDWEQYHDAKNLSIGLAIECAELQELFLWKTEKEIKEFLNTNDGRQKVKEELADIFIFLLYLSDGCNIDLSRAVKEKIEINNEKYPVNKCHSKHKKYSDY